MIRLANVEDAEAIAKVHVRSWQHAYVGIIPQAFLDTLDVETRITSWKAVLSDGVGVTALFERPVGIAGFVSVVASRDPDATETTGEIASIYVDPSHWRQGVGKRLLEWGMQRAGERRWPHVTLWVLRDNRRARAFYEASGWRHDGAERVERILESEVAEVRYAWRSGA